MRLRVFGAILGAGRTPAATGVTFADDAAARYRVVDVMPAFFRAYDSSTDTQARIAAFKTQVIEPNEELFSRRRYQLDDPDLGCYLIKISPAIDKLRAIDVALTTELPAIEQRFDAAFTDMHGVYVGIGPSFGHYDGQTHDLMSGKPGAFFGVDGILAFDGPAPKLGSSRRRTRPAVCPRAADTSSALRSQANSRKRIPSTNSQSCTGPNSRTLSTRRWIRCVLKNS